MPFWNTPAFVYWETSSVISSSPNAPEPFAWGAALRDALAVEAGELLDQCHVVQQQRAVRADAQRMGVVLTGGSTGLRGGRDGRIERGHVLLLEFF